MIKSIILSSKDKPCFVQTTENMKHGIGFVRIYRDHDDGSADQLSIFARKCDLLGIDGCVYKNGTLISYFKRDMVLGFVIDDSVETKNGAKPMVIGVVTPPCQKGPDVELPCDKCDDVDTE